MGWIWSMSGLYMYGIRSRRLLYKEVVEFGSNYKKSYFLQFENSACHESIGSNPTQKDQGRVSARLVWGKKREWAVCFKAAERLQMIGLMVVMFMSYSRVVSVVLVLCGVDPNLRNGYRISGQNVFWSEMSAWWHYRNLILGNDFRGIATLTAYLWSCG